MAVDCRPFSTPLFRKKPPLYISIGGWGQSGGMVTGEEWPETWWQAYLNRWTPEGMDAKLAKLAGFLAVNGGVCSSALKVTAVAQGWQCLGRFGCHAEAQWGIEIPPLRAPFTLGKSNLLLISWSLSVCAAICKFIKPHCVASVLQSLSQIGRHGNNDSFGTCPRDVEGQRWR